MKFYQIFTLAYIIVLQISNYYFKDFSFSSYISNFSVYESKNNKTSAYNSG